MVDFIILEGLGPFNYEASIRILKNDILSKEMSTRINSFGGMLGGGGGGKIRYP